MIRSHFSRDVEDRVEGLDASAGYEDLHGSEITADLRERSVHRCPVCDVYLDSDRLGAPGAQLAGRDIGRRTVAIEDGDVVAVTRELVGDAQADARRATCYYFDTAHRAASVGVNSRCTLVSPRRTHVRS
jgi:hypothetical protein